MNLRARLTGLIFLSALTFFSCEEDITTVGLPPENNLGIFFADIPLGDKTDQIWVDGVNTRGEGIIMVGAYQDPNFGVIEASNYSEIGLANVVFEPDAQFDSAVLQLRISSLYGNSFEGIEHNFEVYQLADSINLTENGKIRNFTSTSTEPLQGLIGEYSAMLYPDSVNLSFEDTDIDLNDGANDSEDTVFYENNFDSEDQYIYKHRVKLDNNYSEQIFNELRTNQYDSTIEVAALFKGIHLRAKDVNGAIVNYTQGIYSGITFYYREDGEAERVTYPISTNVSYNNIKPNSMSGWNMSDFDDLTTLYEPYNTATDKVYLQSGTNLWAKVDLSGIRQAMLDTIPDVIIQNAEIVVENIDGNSGLGKPAILRYFLTSTDSLANENYTAASPPTLGNNSLAVLYDDTNSNYNVSAPLFIELLASSNEFEFDQLVLTHVNSELDISGELLRRLVFNKNDFRLRIYYTLPNK